MTPRKSIRPSSRERADMTPRSRAGIPLDTSRPVRGDRGAFLCPIRPVHPSPLRLSGGFAHE